MKPRFQSQQFPAYMSEYYKDKQINQETLNISSQDTSDSVFHKKVFSICDIIGNFANGFILVHYEGYLYLVDQHAASEKSLFLQYMISPEKKYSVSANIILTLPNYYIQTLIQKVDLINKEGWFFNIIQKRSQQTTIQIVKVPEVYKKALTEEDFLFYIDKLYNENEEEDAYSTNQRSAMATYACKNAYKVGDILKSCEMRGLLDSLYKMDAPFNCPHGRPTLASLGKVSQILPPSKVKKQYTL